MTLYRDMHAAAIAADLTKNELKICFTLINQTLGYNRSSVILTNQELARVTKIRLDRLMPSLEVVMQNGFFYRIEYPNKIYQFKVHTAFLAEKKQKFYTIPLSEKEGADEDGNQTHIYSNPDSSIGEQPLGSNRRTEPPRVKIMLQASLDEVRHYKIQTSENMIVEFSVETPDYTDEFAPPVAKMIEKPIPANSAGRSLIEDSPAVAAMAKKAARPPRNIPKLPPKSQRIVNQVQEVKVFKEVIVDEETPMCDVFGFVDESVAHKTAVSE